MRTLDKLMVELNKIEEMTTTADKTIFSIRERYQKLIRKNTLETDIQYLINKYKGDGLK